MEIIDHFVLGFGVALSLQNLAYCFLGVLLGTLIGVLPGVGPLVTISMLLPMTFGLPPVSAVIMLSGIYYGAQYGGSTTAILVNLPGETSSAVTCLDGYQMARRGRAGAALAIAALSSFVAGCDRHAADLCRRHQPSRALQGRSRRDQRSDRDRGHGDRAGRSGRRR
ncbi:hypothetical protein BTHI11S_06006 [Bosea thiooxidans]